MKVSPAAMIIVGANIVCTHTHISVAKTFQ